jgi:hypothetical protein
MQLPPHPGDVPVQGGLDVGGAADVVAPGAPVCAYSSPSSRVRDNREFIAAAGLSAL